MSDPIFTAAEIDALLRRARARMPASKAETEVRKAEPFNFRGTRELSAGQLAGLSQLHERFAGKLGPSLSALLSQGCEVRFSNAEQGSYGDLIAPLAGSHFPAVLHTKMPDASAILQADLKTALAMIDLLLGGVGAAAEAARPLTEIEREIFKPILRVFCKELQDLWSPVMETDLRIEGHAHNAPDPISPSERILALKFEVGMGELRGEWIAMLPLVILSALTRNTEQPAAAAEHGNSEQGQLRMKERLLNSRFDVELFLPPSAVSVRALANLKVGDVIALKARSTEPIHLNVAGRRIFQASPVGCGAHRGAQVKRALRVVGREQKETR